MANRASDSWQEAASTSSVNGETSTSTSNRKIRLRIKSSLNSTKKVREGEDGEKETKPRSSKRSKSSFKKKIDPNKPKKPPTAFFYFLEEFRRGYQIENPEVKSMRDIGKACGEKWKIMTFEGNGRVHQKKEPQTFKGLNIFPFGLDNISALFLQMFY